MPNRDASSRELLSQVEELRARLDEAEETLRAIRHGEVDALVVNGAAGEQVFTLRGAEYGYRILVETMTEGAVTLRDRGVIYYCNAHLGRLLRMPLEKLIGMRLQQFVAPSQIAAFKTLLDGTDHARRGEFILTVSDGMPLPVLISLSAMSEEMTGTVCAVLTDLRQQKHAETLEKMVTERTAQLREKMGELEAFSYSVSHDIRGPLRSMRNFAQILLEDHGHAFEPEPMAHLQRIKTAGDRLDQLIQNVLTYSQTTRNESELSVISLTEIVREVVESYPNLRNARIELASFLPPVCGYEVGITQCVSNLLANAVKFVPAGKSPVIKLWAEPRDHFVRLWIEDNGIGIAPEDQQRIFQIFSRIHGNEVFEGTGIGLSIVAKAMEKMGGYLGVESELGKGSRFWLEFASAEGRGNETHPPQGLVA